MIGSAAKAELPSPAPKPVSLTPADVIGCYELRSLTWGVARAVKDPPKLFRFHSEIDAHVPIDHMGGHDRQTIAGWQLTGTDEVTAFWSTGFVGVKLTSAAASQMSSKDEPRRFLIMVDWLIEMR